MGTINKDTANCLNYRFAKASGLTGKKEGRQDCRESEGAHNVLHYQQR